jgi:hypothetical protein
LKLGNNVARFAFDYMDLPTRTPGFIPRETADGGLRFDPDTLEPRRVAAATIPSDDTAEANVGASNDAPLVLEKNPIPYLNKDATELARAGEVIQPALSEAVEEEESLHGPEYVREP